jgi:hypothetical protein
VRGTNSQWFFDGNPCPKCGAVHEADRCAGHKKTGQRGVYGPPCRQRHMRGSAVCRIHGALTPGGKAGAARRIARAETEAEIRGFLLSLGDPDPVDYLVALEEHYLAKLQEVRVLRWAVRQRELDELTWSVTAWSVKEGGYDTGTKEEYKAGLSVLLQWMHKAEDQLTVILKLCDQAGMTVKRKEYLDRVGASVAVAMQAYAVLLMAELEALGVGVPVRRALEGKASELAHRALLTLDDGQPTSEEARV